MAESIFACEENYCQNPETFFSDSEIEAARQLVQLSSGASETDNVNDKDSSNNDSYSVQQGKPQQSKADSVGDVCSIEDVLADEDESFGRRRRNKRYRYIDDLYRVTEPLPVPVVEEKKKMKSRK